MEKDEKMINLNLEGGTKGSVKISDDVLAMIAGLAATEVDGVSSMNGNITHEILNKIGYKNLAKGVKVETFQNKVRVDMEIIMEYGFNIPGTCRNVQEKVKSAVESMTGLEVVDVNVRISGVNVAAR